MLVISSVKEVMNVNCFLNPPKDDGKDSLVDLDDINTFFFASNDALSDGGGVVMKDLHTILTDETLENHYKLQLYEEQQP